MYIQTPSTIETVAWEGELVAPATSYGIRGGRAGRPVATVGRPEVWPVPQVLQSKALVDEAVPTWTPPLGNAEFWLVRLACTLRQPGGASKITEAEQRLALRPRNTAAEPRTTYAYSLFPDRMGVEDSAELAVSLAPELKFGKEVQVKAGQLGAKIDYRKVFPVVQSYGAGEPTPYWVFRSHRKRPIDGSQFVYAVVAAEKAADGIRALVSLTATVESKFGPIRWGLPEEAKAQTRIDIP